MENIGKPTSSEARTALDDIDRVQRAVRDTPWPVWLYPVNALLVGAIALTPLLGDVGRVVALLTLAFATIAVNVITGYRMGTPWALPTSRGFLASVALSAAFVVVALAFADPPLPAWALVLLAVAAATTYSIGSFVHYRSTRR
ncbi:putative uncharacterized protein [Rhodococcus sp. AW25M09]|uniref:hypothetical protein n=1 Tax=Rhodococcus sp. AW25M09 TaxID=1268303 RepID=UPI0002AC40F7|nr:hypothetical protein [Rhodococcus sp. AW25M09]CCQ16363.1 putative uncharacterized protein [Rhodococcus sp. AW25M09]